MFDHHRLQPTPPVIACPAGVISPGLVNPHEHLTYQNNPPIVHAEKYENRSDWQGARGHTRLDYAERREHRPCRRTASFAS